MKSQILTPLAVIMLTTLSSADDQIYPLDIKMRVYPEEICYGDLCFLTFSVTNKGRETLYLPYGATFLRQIVGSLYCGEKAIVYLSGFDDCEGVFTYGTSAPPDYPGHPVEPGESMEFHIRMTWLPLPEFCQTKQARGLLKLVSDGEKSYRFSYLFHYRSAFFSTVRPRFDENGRLLSREDFPADELSYRELEAKGYKVAEDVPPSIIEESECTIHIFPRSEEELQLLQDWYLELPTTGSSGRWTMEHVFAHPFHVNGSPYKMDIPMFFESNITNSYETLGKKREPFYGAYCKFFSSMETRTPESLARIKRTNELAAKILERAKQPDSTISQNMVEFIKLRSFLVDMRYAENPQSEQAAFDKLVKFVENTKDKELWLKFLNEIGFWSIVNYTHFKPEKVEQYRKKFREHFADDFARIGWTNRP